MRLDTPRIAPLADNDFDDEQNEVVAPFREHGPLFNVSRTFIHHAKAQAAFRIWATHVMAGSTLSERAKEIIALRTAWNAKVGYMWGRHVSMGHEAGLADAEIEALKRPVDAYRWADADKALILSTDGLVLDFFVPDAAWQMLSAHYDQKQIADVILACGHFCMLGMFLNSAGVQLDAGVPADADLRKLAS